MQQAELPKEASQHSEVHLCTQSRTNLEPHSQGDKHPPSDQTQTINAAQEKDLGHNSPSQKQLPQHQENKYTEVTPDASRSQ